MTEIAREEPVAISEEEFLTRQRLFHDFLDAPTVWNGDADYKERIRHLLKTRGKRLLVNLNDLRQFNQEATTSLLRKPLEWLPPFEKAFQELVTNIWEPALGGFAPADTSGYHIGLEGAFGELHTDPRQLSARLLSHMVCLDGIVTACSLVRPKLLRSVHYSESTETFLARDYFDATMPSVFGQPPPAINYPTEGDDGKRLLSEFGLSVYRDYQTITIQEMPEKAPAGQLPRSVDVVLDADLVDRVKPGDRARAIGVYKSLATSSNGQIPSTFRAVIIANNVSIISREASMPSLAPDDLVQIRQISRRPDLFDLLARSLAPSIYGHEYVKKAVLLMLLGGVEKNLDNGSHLRGDINLMLVGDPSTAKSQMLRFVLGIAPLAIATTGRGSSGVGLTAAVTSDRETGERRLEAGAMVLADRGVVCIDEFDKMNDADRVAIHEVMEQQTVTIAKAGIHASLNARCSVLAAANPIWGQYRESASPQENIRLPDSLLSRFDLLFILLDQANPEHDRRISKHVLRMHRTLDAAIVDDDENEFANETTVFQRYTSESIENTEEIEEGSTNTEHLTIPFVRKYIHYARTRVVPVLTKAASEHIVAAYSEFRQKREQADLITEARTFPVTPRTLETLIRLATAHAKARLSSRVERKDAKVAQEMIQFCLYKEVKKKPSKRRRKRAMTDEEESEAKETSEDDEDDSNDDGGNMGEALASLSINPSNTQISRTSALIQQSTQIGSTLEGDTLSVNNDSDRQYDRPLFDFQSQSQSQSQSIYDSLTTHSSISTPAEWTTAVRSALHRLRTRPDASSFFTPDQLRTELAAVNPAMEAAINDNDFDQIILEMEASNMLMYRDGNIILI